MRRLSPSLINVHLLWRHKVRKNFIMAARIRSRDFTKDFIYCVSNYGPPALIMGIEGVADKLFRSRCRSYSMPDSGGNAQERDGTESRAVSFADIPAAYGQYQ